MFLFAARRVEHQQPMRPRWQPRRNDLFRRCLPSRLQQIPLPMARERVLTIPSGENPTLSAATLLNADRANS